MSALPQLRRDTGVERMWRYMDDVRSGAVPACMEVRQAVDRQIRDVANEDFAYYFDIDSANRVVEFIEMLPHVKGKEFVGRTIDLEPWQCFILCTVFGWLDIEGNRRFRAAYIEVPRKNAKSTLSSGVGLYLLTADHEPGSEVYSAATTRDQAKIVFDVAKAMVEKNLSGLKMTFDLETFGGKQQAGAIVESRTGGVFRPLARDQGGNLDGLNVHCGIIDELHAHKTRDVYDVVETGTGARTQPLIWAITTAGFNRAGICYEQRGYVRKLLSGVEEDDTYFGIIYTIDEKDDWKDEASWIKANPNWGVSVLPDDIRRKAAKAIATASAQNNFLTKHMNVWVNAGVAWMNMVAFQKCAQSVTFEEYHGKDVWIAIDLASRVDVAAINYTWKEGGRVISKSRYYLPADTIDEEKNASYPGWVIDGHITATPGAKTDFKTIEAQLEEDCRNFNVQAIGYDPYQAQYLANNLAELGIEVVEYAQNMGNMSEPMKEWEGLVMAGQYVYDGNPVTTWMVSNVVCHIDAKDNVYPRKEDVVNKIDGAVAQIMNIGLTAGVEGTQDVVFL